MKIFIFAVLILSGCANQAMTKAETEEAQKRDAIEMQYTYIKKQLGCGTTYPNCY